jgi:hypothetical protein
MRYATCPILTTKQLIADDTIRADTRKEIEATQAKYLDLKYFVRGFVSKLTERQKHVREMTQNACNDALRQLEETSTALIERGGDEDPTNFIYVKSVEDDEEELHFISFDHFSRLAEARENWESLEKAQFCYTSNEIFLVKDCWVPDPVKMYISK